MDYREKLKDLYREARNFVDQGNRDAAFVALERFVRTAYTYWKEYPAPEEKAEMKSLINEWAAVAIDIKENGISDDVRKKFALKIKDIPQPPPPTDWEEEVFEKRKTGVVRISTDTGTAGTGFIISKSGYLLTNEHVIANSSGLCMSFIEEYKSYKMHKIDADKKWDIALCKFEPTDISSKFTYIPRIKDYSKMRPGANIMIIGNAKGRGLAPVPGTIRYLHDEYSGDLVSTVLSNGGDSGSPVFNRSGECIGIHKSSDKEAKGFAYATPMNKIEELLEKWKEAHKVEL